MPIVPQPPSSASAQGTLCLQAVVLYVCSWVPLINMCKIIPHFISWDNSPAWFSNTFSDTGCRDLWATFYIHSSLTDCSLTIQGQSQIPPWRSLAIVPTGVDTADSWPWNYMIECFWKVILSSVIHHLITPQPTITSTSSIYLSHKYLDNMYCVSGSVTGVLQVLTF